MGTAWKVSVLPKKEWKEEPGCVGVSDFNNCEIRVMRNKRDVMEHVYLHELTHVVLAAMGHKLQTNEAFVDTFAGLCHQALTTGK